MSTRDSFTYIVVTDFQLKRNEMCRGICSRWETTVVQDAPLIQMYVQKTVFPPYDIRSAVVI